MPKGLPVVPIEADLPKDQKLAADGTPLVRIGEEVTVKLGFRPAQFLSGFSGSWQVPILGVPERVADCGSWRPMRCAPWRRQSMLAAPSIRLAEKGSAHWSGSITPIIDWLD